MHLIFGRNPIELLMQQAVEFLNLQVTVSIDVCGSNSGDEQKKHDDFCPFRLAVAPYETRALTETLKVCQVGREFRPAKN